MNKYKKIYDKGDIFGNLTVLQIDTNKQYTKDGKLKVPSKWNYICQCSLCSNIVSVPKESLQYGKTSCGCDSHKYPKYLKNGDTFGDLTIDSVEESSKFDDDGKSVWPTKWKYWCVCKCGNRRLVDKDKLTQGRALHCGCQSWGQQKLNRIEECGDLIKLYASNNDKIFSIIDKNVYHKVKQYCWHITTNGYFRTMGLKNFKDDYLPKEFSGGSSFGLHNYLIGRFNDLDVDHINKNRLDNRITNLRTIPRIDNTRNRRIQNAEYGITYDKERNKWYVQIGVNYKNVYIGRYASKAEAIKARKEAEEKYFGEANPRNSPYKTLETILTESGFYHEEIPND